jgi:hypothetical protein
LGGKEASFQLESPAFEGKAPLLRIGPENNLLCLIFNGDIAVTRIDNSMTSGVVSKNVG